MNPLLTPGEVVKRPLFFPLLILVVLIIAHDAVRKQPSVDSSLLYRKAVFYGVVAENPKQEDGKTKFPIRLVENSSLGTGKVLVTVLGRDLPIRRNDVIEFEARLKEPVSYRNPGGFDYAKYLGRRGIGATAFVADPSAIRVVSSRPSFRDRKTANIKERTKKVLSEKAGLPAQGVLLALLWGEESLVDDHTETLFRDQGLSHLLVISGLHFTAVAFVVFELLIFFFKLFPRLFLYWPVRKISAGATFVFLTAYFLFCEPGPSITRAYIAVGCYLAALVLNRSRDILNILFLAAILILAANPQDLFSLSFQFSFVSVLSLIFVYPFVKKILAGFKKRPSPGFLQRVAGKMADYFVVNLSIFLGLTPLLVFYFHETQANGFFMNLWAVPVVELLAVPLGLFALVFQFVVPSVSSVLFSADLKLIEGVLFILEKASAFLFKPFLVFPPHGWELVLYYILVLTVMLDVSRRLKKWIVVVILMVFVGDVFFNLFNAYRSDDFRITQLDVGQGDSIFVELPGAKRVLIDGGGSPYFDVGKNVLVPFLLHQRIPAVDVLCVTHAHADHYMGFLSLIEKYNVGQLWWNGIERNDSSYRNLLALARKKKIPVLKLASGMKIPVGDSAVFEVLSPEDGVIDKDINNQSVVLRLSANNRSAVFTGDIQIPVEYRLMSRWGSKLDADYLKVPHHGSKGSNSLLFLKAVSPEVATAGLGFKNRYRHPHADVLKNFGELKIPLFRTDLQGAVEVEFVDDEIEVNAFTGRSTVLLPFPRR